MVLRTNRPNPAQRAQIRKETIRRNALGFQQSFPTQNGNLSEQIRQNVSNSSDNINQDGVLSPSEFEKANRQLFEQRFGKEYSQQALARAYGVYYQQTSTNPNTKILEEYQLAGARLPPEIRREVGEIGIAQAGGQKQKVLSGYEGGFSAAGGGEGGFSQGIIGRITQTYQGPASNPNFVASSVEGKNFVIEKSGKVVEPIASYQGGGIITQEKPRIIPKTIPVAPKKSEREFSEAFLETVPFNRVNFSRDVSKDKKLPEILAGYKVRETIEKNFLEPAVEFRKKRLEKESYTPSDEFALFSKKAREQTTEFAGGIVITGLGASATIFSDPQKATEDVYRLGQEIYKVEYGQIAPDQPKIVELRNSVLGQAKKEPAFLVGGLIGGGVFDKAIGGPALRFIGRPVSNIVSTTKNISRGIEVGVVEGTTSYNIIKKGSQTFLLVPDIHPTLRQVPEIGDLPLNQLVKQTKAGTGRKTGGLTLVGGSLTNAKPGDEFLLRQLRTHWKGVKESPFYSSPEAEFSRDVVVATNLGKKTIIPKGAIVQVGSKQFASGLSETGYSGEVYSLTKSKALGILTNEPVSRVSRSKNVFEYRRRFFEPSQSAKSQIQFSNEILASVERQKGFQAQGVRFYRSRGTKLKIQNDKPIDVDIFNRKLLPLNLDKRFPGLQKFYEDVGFGREYKSLTLLQGQPRIPVGRPPSKDFEGKPIYIRPTARAVVESPLTKKLLFVQEGKGSLIFPGGGVDPINVSGQGKEGIRLDYPKVKDFGQTAVRELYEETSGIALSSKRIPGIVIESKVSAFNPPVKIGRKPNQKVFPVFQFKDVNRFYKVKSIPLYKPSAEITKLYQLTPKEALLSSNVGKVEKEFIRQYYFGKNPSKRVFESDLRLKDKQKILEEISERDYSSYRPPRPVSLQENLPTFNFLSKNYQKDNQKQFNKNFERVFEKKRFEEKTFSPTSNFYELKIKQNEKSDKTLRKIYQSYPREGTRNYITEIPREPKETVIRKEPYKSIEKITNVRKPPLTPEITYKPPKPPYTPPTYRKQRDPLPSFRKSFEEGFSVGLFKGGKLDKILDIGPLTKREAIATGAREVEEKIARSFKIFPTKQRVTARGITGPTYILRPGKRDPSLFVEKEKFAISTRTEKRTLREARLSERILKNKNSSLRGLL